MSITFNDWLEYKSHFVSSIPNRMDAIQMQKTKEYFWTGEVWGQFFGNASNRIIVNNYYVIKYWIINICILLIDCVRSFSIRCLLNIEIFTHWPKLKMQFQFVIIHSAKYLLEFIHYVGHMKLKLYNNGIQLWELFIVYYPSHTALYALYCMPLNGSWIGERMKSKNANGSIASLKY